MKKNGPLNSELTKVLADLGHTDSIVIADCGLPIPDHVKKIDLALTLGTPSFEEVLAVLRNEMEIEKATVASEMKEYNRELAQRIDQEFNQLVSVDHETFKVRTQQAKAIIRTGEATPYANIILHAGVIF
ncbi:D-ribose pyranase [Jeotgalibacillus proteolyticus]|uniref:D-ribose pyranase n=1 Tax=Jeotgalibacillus proteolyticus TaxID=2082395 RepID=A0A2S5G8M0_9BACL|nr:D-ribose pyranase [Jeotgalibacillus proteolyticus]PPA69352.1 D-ribose pyranase [Jeotgalibacillus proteolyticus]